MTLINYVTAPFINYVVKAATNKALQVCDPLISKVSDVSRKYLPRMCLTAPQLLKNSCDLIAQSENTIQEYSKLAGESTYSVSLSLQYEAAEGTLESQDKVKNMLAAMRNGIPELKAQHAERAELSSLLGKVRNLPKEEVFKAIEDLALDGYDAGMGVSENPYVQLINTAIRQDIQRRNIPGKDVEFPNYNIYQFPEDASPNEIQTENIQVLRSILNRCSPDTEPTSLHTTPQNDTKIDLS